MNEELEMRSVKIKSVVRKNQLSTHTDSIQRFLIPHSSFLIKLTSFLIILLLIAGQVHAQNAASEAPRVFTLDQTIQTLYSAVAADENEFRWDPFFRDGSFSIGGHYGAFSTALTDGQTGFLMVDHRDIYPVPLPYLNNGELVFPESFVMTAMDAFNRSVGEDDARYQIAAIIIDPGRGGKDTGAVGVEMTMNGKRHKVMEKEPSRKKGSQRNSFSSAAAAV